MTDRTPYPEASARAAEYVLGVMPHAERLAFAAELARSPALQREVRFWEQHFASLAGEVAPEAPPARAFKAIEDRLFGKGQTKSSWWQSLGFWRGLSFASLAALALLAGAYVFERVAPDPATQTYVAELRGEGNVLKVLALYDSRSNTLRINRIEGAAANNRDLELWMIEGDKAPVSMGVLPREQIGLISVSAALKDKISSSLLAITDEPAGGSPTGQATGAILATGRLSLI